MKYNLAKTGAYAGIGSSMIFILFFMLAVINYAGYNPNSNFLSDLGAGASAIFFNSGLFLSGFLGIIFGFGLNSFLKKKARMGAKIIVASSAALVATGIFPEQYGMIHDAVSGVFFVLSAIAMIIIGGVFRKEKLGYFSAAAGFVPVVFVLTDLPVVEHIAVFGIVLWELSAAVYMLRKS